MKCLGRTKQLTRCRNNARLLFCHQHRIYAWALAFSICSVVAIFAGLYQDLISPVYGLVADFAGNGKQPQEPPSVVDGNVDKKQISVSNDGAVAKRDIQTTAETHQTFRVVNGKETTDKSPPPHVDVDNQNAKAGRDINTTVTINSPADNTLNDYVTFEGESEIPIYKSLFTTNRQITRTSSSTRLT